MQAPLDQVIGYGSAWLTRGRIGPHCRAGDSLRYWVHWLRTDDPRTLWSPLLGHRRQSDWDDHGEDYPATWDGPDVWAEVSVPAGVHRVSLYFVNKDGHDGPNRWRDYLVEVKPHRQGVRTADAEPPFARARVSDFWGGKYLQFVARGPATLDFKIDRHYSFNTILQAVFLDRLSGPRLPEEQTMPAPLLGLPPTADHEPVTGGLAGKLWRELDSAWEREGSALWQQPWRVLCYRAALAGGSTADLAAWRDALPLWLASDRAQQRALAQRAWAVLAARQPRLAQRPAR
jgi:hypothetical protein